MKHAYLIRTPSDTKQTLGVLVAQDGAGLFVCKTLELPWLKNENNISCITEGEFICKWTRSNRLSAAAGKDVYTYEVLTVPHRTGIRLHSANFFFQLLGCIALGDAHKDINADGELDLIHSGETVGRFAVLMGYRDFLLTIVTLNMDHP